MPEVQISKQCSVCGKSYPLSYFVIKEKCKYGRGSICKKCKDYGDKRYIMALPEHKKKRVIAPREGLQLLESLQKHKDYCYTDKKFESLISALNDCEKKYHITGNGCDTCPCKKRCVSLYDLRFA